MFKVTRSLVSLWSNLIPEAAQTLETRFKYCFNYLRFADSQCVYPATLLRLRTVRDDVLNIITETVNNSGINNITSNITACINSQNKKWAQNITSTKPRHYSPKKKIIERLPDPIIPVDRSKLSFNTENLDDEMVQFITLHARYVNKQ